MEQKRIFSPRRSLVFLLIASLSILTNLSFSLGASSLNLPQIPVLSQSLAENLPENVESAVRRDLARKTDLEPSQFQVLAANRETWPDGCLGLANQDQLCTQALVPGWRVKMGYGQQVWIYRTDAQGKILRLE